MRCVRVLGGKARIGGGKGWRGGSDVREEWMCVRRIEQKGVDEKRGRLVVGMGLGNLGKYGQIGVRGRMGGL